MVFVTIVLVVVLGVCTVMAGPLHQERPNHVNQGIYSKRWDFRSFYGFLQETAVAVGQCPSQVFYHKSHMSLFD